MPKEKETGGGSAESSAAPLEMTPEAFRAAGYDLVDRIADFIGSLPDRPAAPDVSPQQVRSLLGDGPLPEQGGDPKSLLQQAADLCMPYNRLNGHPRSWGFIIGSPAPIGALADLLAAAVNPNVAGWNGAAMASEIELQAVRWIAELIGYPNDCGGLLVSGGNMANFIGFLAARRAKADWDVRRSGLAGSAARPLSVYVSEQTHTWIEKAADLFGLGAKAIRWIETDAEYRMDVDALETRIREDRDKGRKPFLIVGAAGTVSTGAVDPLPQLAEIAKKNDLWFHVDGAYGAPAVAARGTSPDLQGLRQADSIAVDAHKWLFAPLEAGCALVRDRSALHDTFSYHPPYYHFFAHEQEVVNFHEYGPQNSRGFRALKVWLTLRQAGRSGYVAMLEKNLELARALAAKLREGPDIEVHTQTLSITTFRYVPANLAAAAERHQNYLNRLNAELLANIQKSGEAYLSNAVLNGKFLLRACITNFRTKLKDVGALPEIVRRLGSALDGEIRPKELR